MTGLVVGVIWCAEVIKCNFEPSAIWWSSKDPSCNGLPFRTNFCWFTGIFNWSERRDFICWIVSCGDTCDKDAVKNLRIDQWTYF